MFLAIMLERVKGSNTTCIDGELTIGYFAFAILGLELDGELKDWSAAARIV